MRSVIGDRARCGSLERRAVSIKTTEIKTMERKEGSGTSRACDESGTRVVRATHRQNRPFSKAIGMPGTSRAATKSLTVKEEAVEVLIMKDATVKII
jgi:hypothetical protein